jgi:NAD(P)-dependent dehydrogenase (short-subunit alcohol dehydrogenase family)
MVVLITGAAHRIGREISIFLAKQGHSIAVHYKNSKEGAVSLAAIINSIGNSKAKIYQADLSDTSSCRRLIEDISRNDTIEHMVNNASSFEHDNISTMTSRSFDENISINLKAPLFLSKEFIAYRHHLDNHPKSSEDNTLVYSPCIVNILDMKIASTNADNLSYTVAKHGLHNITEMLAKECAPHIRGKL